MALRVLCLLVLAAPLVTAPGALLAQTSRPSPWEAAPKSPSPSPTPWLSRTPSQTLAPQAQPTSPSPSSPSQTPAPQTQTSPQAPAQTVPAQSGSVAEEELRRRSGSAAERMVKSKDMGPDLTLRCRPQLGSAQIVCTESSLASPSKRLVEPQTVFGTSLSLHMANNLATKSSTAKLLQSVTGNAKFASKAAPTLMQLSKSMPARFGLAFAVVGSGALVVYEYLGGDGGQAQAKPLARGSSYEVPSTAFKKIGEVGADGVFRPAPAAKSP
jgi:hypothetical protein